MAVIATLDEVIRRSDIVEVAKTLGLQLGPRHADHTLATCPFHTDSRPSLALYQDPGNPHYHCFACGAHGGVIDLVEQKLHTSRREAIHWLAREMGVDLPRQRSGALRPDDEPGLEEFEAWLDSHHSSELLQRFAERRHIDTAVLREVGARAVDMNNLALGELSPGQREAWEQTGVLVRRRGELAAITRGAQIVFPVVGGFIFRTIDDDASGDKGRRYRFSKGLKKSDVLFGVGQAAKRLAAGETSHGLFVVEGIMDVLRLQSLGFAGVGILGTSLSSRQTEQISRLCLADGTSVLSPRCLLTSFGQIEMVIRMSYFSGQILTKLSISSPGGPILHLPSSSPDTLVSQSIVPLRS